MSKTRVSILAVLAMTVLFAVVAGNAKADSSNGIAIVSSSAESDVSVSIKYVEVGTWDMHTKGLLKKHGHPVCFWRSGTWTNSMKTPVVTPFRETSRAHFCWLRHPITINGVTYTAVKIGGGLTGAHCWNLAIPPGQPQPKHVINGPVLAVRAGSTVTIPVKVNATATASVTGQLACSGGTISGTATGSAVLNSTQKFVLSMKLLMSNHGSTSGTVKASIMQQIKLSIEETATSKATANLHLECGAPPPPPPPPPSVKLVLSNLTHPQDGPGGVTADGMTMPVCVTATSTKPGNVIKLSFGASLGSFSPGVLTFTSTGTDTECTTYTAPNDTGDVGKTETWTVNGVDTTAGVLADNPAQVSFTLQAPATGR